MGHVLPDRRMRAGHLMNSVFLKQRVEARIAVRMSPSLLLVQMRGWMFAFPVSTEPVPRRRWRFAIPRPFIADIGPDTTCRKFLFGLHLDRGISGKDGFTKPYIAPDRIGQWFQQF